MINHLDHLLRDLLLKLLKEVADLTDEAQVRFQPPDEGWRGVVDNFNIGGQPRNLLNIYLVDLRENRKLRSNERVRMVENGTVSDKPAPARVDCHYLISAWSPAAVTGDIEPTIDEHRLLYQVMAVLLQHVPLNPSRFYGVQPPLPPKPQWPKEFWEQDLPTVVLPPEGFPMLAEFWGTMGAGHRWRPAVYLIVTLPVALLKEAIAPMVTTKIIHYGQRRVFYALKVRPPLPHDHGGGTGLRRTTIDPSVAELQALANIGAVSITVVSLAGLNAGDVLMIGSGSSTEFSRLGPLPAAGTTVPIEPSLRYQHEAGTPLHRVVHRDVIGTLSAVALKDAQALSVGEATVARLHVGDVLKLDDPVHPAYVQITTISGPHTGLSSGSETLIQIGGQVVEAGVARTPLTGAKVTLIELKLTATTNAQGRFTFANLSPGTYHLEVYNPGYAPIGQTIKVPGASGEYDVSLWPIP